MSTEENKAVVGRWFQAFNERDLAAEEAARSADFVAHVAGAPAPLNGAMWQSFIAAFFTGFPDFRLDLQDVLAEADRVAVRWTFRGTHAGEFQGIGPTGKTVSMSAVEVNRVADGKVAEHWVVFDQFGLLQQLGAIPVPGEGGR
ncbi:MAG TPA: ester cyclase [Chloroflexota bacterium]|jgi:steroid delta-isomerase-like uncharacterized protein|nr:ester cyclase [Chloroflexota bacterium]